MFVLFTICLVLFRFCVFWRHYVFDYSLGFMFIFRTCLIMSDTQCLLWLHDFFLYRSRFWIALNCFLEFSCSMGFRSGHSNVLIELAAQKCVPLFYFTHFIQLSRHLSHSPSFLCSTFLWQVVFLVRNHAMI